MHKPRNVVFLGTSAFAVPCLEALTKDPAFDVTLVITQPDRPVGRKQVVTPPPVKQTAIRIGIPVEQPEKLRELSVRPDFLVVVSYGQILPSAVLNAAVIAPVNVHASLLPKLRGASPIQHTILQGMKVAGVTVQRMEQELDAGPILAQKTLALDGTETFTSLHDDLARLGASLLVETLKHDLKPVPQNISEATFCTKLKKSDGEADPSVMTAETIDRMIRALTPWPGVTLRECKILGASLEPTKSTFPLPCAKNTTLHIATIQSPGGKPMDGASFLRGRPDFLQ